MFWKVIGTLFAIIWMLNAFAMLGCGRVTMEGSGGRVIRYSCHETSSTFPGQAQTGWPGPLVGGGILLAGGLLLYQWWIRPFRYDMPQPVSTPNRSSRTSGTGPASSGAHQRTSESPSLEIRTRPHPVVTVPSSTQTRTTVTLKPETLERVRQAGLTFSPSLLNATLSTLGGGVQFQDLDPAMKRAIGFAAHHIIPDTNDAVTSAAGGLILTSYLFGRRVMNTAWGSVHYSNPDTEKSNAETLIDRSANLDNLYEEGLGPVAKLLVETLVDSATSSGPLSYLVADRRDTIATTLATLGLRLAIAEHDEFVA